MDERAWLKFGVSALFVVVAARFIKGQLSAPRSRWVILGVVLSVAGLLGEWALPRALSVPAILVEILSLIGFAGMSLVVASLWAARDERSQSTGDRR